MKRIAIIGMGYVGQAFYEFAKGHYEIVTYDIKDETPYPEVEIDTCALAVVCVPTPMNSDGGCNTLLVEDAVSKLSTPLIMLKSAVKPGTTDKLKEETGKRIVVSPEYVGESKYHNPVYKTMKDTPYQIVGGDKDDVRECFEILEKIAGPYCTYFSCSAIEAEIIKYMENSFLATKVTFVNEFYNIAKLFGADWHKVREGWLLDERIGRAFSTVFADDRGFGGKCLPKDISAIIKAAEDKGYSADVLKSVVKFNEEIRLLSSLPENKNT